MGERYRNVNNDLYVVGNNATKLDRDYNTSISSNKQYSDERRYKQVPRRVVKRYRYKMKLSAILVMTMVMCIVMVKTQCAVSNRCHNIVKLENELNNLKINNKLIREGMNTNIDLEYVYEVATTKLGMVVPSKRQVTKFAVAENSYTEQLDEITVSDKKQGNSINNIFGFILSSGR